MIETLITSDRRRMAAAARRNRRNKDIGAAKLHVDTRLTLLHGTEHLGAEHALVIARGRLRVRAAQVDMVVGELGHGGCLPVSPCCNKLEPTRLKSQRHFRVSPKRAEPRPPPESIIRKSQCTLG